nr:hypothetical protein GCM10020093_039730 [Planobispora longispora]
MPPLVFLNAEPAALNHPYTPELLAVVHSERPYRAVLEFTERALADHPAALLNIAAGVQQTDGALALDDVGADPLSLAFLPLIEPEVIKLDMHLLRDPHAPPPSRPPRPSPPTPSAPGRWCSPRASRPKPTRRPRGRSAPGGDRAGCSGGPARSARSPAARRTRTPGSARPGRTCTCRTGPRSAWPRCGTTAGPGISR